MLVRQGGQPLRTLALGRHRCLLAREEAQSVFPLRELYSHKLFSHAKLANSLLLGKNIVQDPGQAQLKLHERKSF
jgi:hypothetical protein